MPSIRPLCVSTPYIDILQIHRFDPLVTPEETMKTLHDLVESGKAHGSTSRGILEAP
ncbi:hypothetical protein AZE42_07408 [Rhizopogon vesiculosus]|uniref:NADP-dependent oxidoreductase domain-containing protein n=1 Tax=Rhizopogon vesiculosus TaxID=180088 RepID=A0A1J8PXI9_9AGAM|nr:hypothetical protein AZE42_07408 [Rhizopogon vesiculosus]